MYAVSDLSFAVLESQPVAGRAVHCLLLFAKTQSFSAASDALQTDPPSPAYLASEPAKPAWLGLTGMTVQLLWWKK
jgi:hypothetical protein